MKSLIALEPSRALFNQNRIFHSLMDDLLSAPVSSELKRMASFSPATNITELADAFELEVLIPGFTKEQINIEVHNNVLHLKGEIEKTEKTSDESAPKNKVVRKEFYHSAFERNFKLGNQIETDAIAAEVSNGILKVTLPKKESAKASEPKRILIG